MQRKACNEVYYARILRGREAYSAHKLGALGPNLGATVCFFAKPWHHVSPALTETDHAWLLNEAAFYLRALVRLTEALEPMRAALENSVKLGNWENAAICASNLSELELTLGLVDGDEGALHDAEQSVSYADRSGDAFRRTCNRITLANALHQVGRREEAEARFREAERIQADDQSDYPLLYSLQGFRYCDLLLTQVERAAAKAEAGIPQEEWLAVCSAVFERGEKTLEWRQPSDSLLDIALDHLNQGRSALYAAALSSVSPTSLAPVASQLEQAVSGLRRAGHQFFLPSGLLTRAWLRRLTGPLTGAESAQSDLDEAWEIAGHIGASAFGIGLVGGIGKRRGGGGQCASQGGHAERGVTQGE